VRVPSGFKRFPTPVLVFSLEFTYFKEMDTFLDNIDVTVDEVLKKRSGLKTDKSAGPDSLHPKVLFEVRQSISYPLYVLFNKSLSEGVVPEDWKTVQKSVHFLDIGVLI
jgi:hypothetical protein